MSLLSEEVPFITVFAKLIKSIELQSLVSRSTVFYHRVWKYEIDQLCALKERDFPVDFVYVLKLDALLDRHFFQFDLASKT